MGEMPVQHREAELRGVRLMGELGFGEEDASHGNAVAAADQRAVLVPHLEGVVMARVVQSGVCAYDARGDPGDVPASFTLSGTGLHHPFEIAIEGDGVLALAHEAPQPLGDVILVEEQHAALFRGARKTSWASVLVSRILGIGFASSRGLFADDLVSKNKHSLGLLPRPACRILMHGACRRGGRAEGCSLRPIVLNKDR
jgi:hypothetical protein